MKKKVLSEKKKEKEKEKGEYNGRPKGFWTLDLIRQEALKYSKRSLFARENKGAYMKARAAGWLEEVCSHMDVRDARPAHYWTFELLKEEALKYENRSAFGRKSKGAYVAACRIGCLDEICSHMRPHNQPPGYWKIERVRAEALKYQVRSAFAKEGRRAYVAACRKGWLNDVCSHMAPQQTTTTEEQQTAPQEGEETITIVDETRVVLDV